MDADKTMNADINMVRDQTCTSETCADNDIKNSAIDRLILLSVAVSRTCANPPGVSGFTDTVHRTHSHT